MADKEKENTEEISLDNLPKPWTIKQFLFAKAYIGEADCNATKAAKIAGFSEATAYSAGQRLLRNVEFSHIQDYIKAELGEIIQKYDVSKEALVQRLAEITNTDISEIVEFTDSGRLRLKRLEDIPKTALRAVRAISDKSGNTDEVSVQMHCPISAIEKIAKLQKLFTEDEAREVNNVVIYIPDNGRNDPAHMKPEEKTEDAQPEN